MNTQTYDRQRTQGNRFTDLWTVLTRYAYHWPLFALGLILALSAAFAYLQIARPVYGISATILVKDEKKSPQEKSALQELNQQSVSNNAETEIQILQSKNLVTQVVNDLQLWASYTSRKGLVSQDVYATRPFTFVRIPGGRELSAQKLDITINNGKTFSYTNTNGTRQTAAFGQVIKNSLGSWMLKPTAKLRLYTGSTISVAVTDPEKTANAYLKSLDVHLLDKLAPTIGLFINDEVPERGKDVLNHLINNYNGITAAEEKRTTKSTIDFIDSRLASLTGELNHAEKEVASFRTAEGLTDINSQSKVYLENVQANDSKLNEVNVQLNVLTGVERFINSSSLNENAPAMVGIDNPALNNLVENLSQLQLKRVALLATTPEKNPEFVPINDQIRKTREGIRENIQGVKSTLQGTRRELQSFNNKFESSIKNIPGQERQFVGMKRQQSIKENLYVYLLQKREELALSYASTVSDARIVDHASVGDVVWPRLPLVIVIALICGLALPFMIVYFRQSYNRKITGRGEIEEALDIPIIEELSYQESNKNGLLANNMSLISEQFRSLRTNLYYLYEQTSSLLSGQPKTARVTLITSSVSSEGKSFVSANLATSMAASGKKTVVLEMDMRRPKISGIFGLPSRHPGITDFLSSGRLTAKDIVQPSSIKNLDVIGSGAIVSNPSELLENGELSGLIEELKANYDNIVIDTPPLHLVTDAMIIGKEADASLYIIRQGTTGEDELGFIAGIQQDKKLPNMRLVFNGINKAKYGYGYSFDNSYYYDGQAKPSIRGSFKTFLTRF